MRHGSLFSGIGGFDLAAEWMGWENVFHCEWNEFGQKVLKHYWPKAISYNDITTTDFTIHRGNIDILTGGFPCQPYSQAGKRLGKADERHLWPHMLRSIREIQPTYVVAENVRGLVNWNGGMVFDEVQADLEAAGYEVTPFLLPACGVNAPHRRDRVWFVAKNTNSRRSEESELQHSDISTRPSRDNIETTPDTGSKAGDVAHPNKSGFQKTRAKLSAAGIEQYGELVGTPPHPTSLRSDRTQEHEDGSGQGGERRGCDVDNISEVSGRQITTHPHSNGRNGSNSEHEIYSSEGGEYALNDFEQDGITYTYNERLEGFKVNGGTKSFWQERNKQFTGCIQPTWQNFPTQPPICGGNDGIPRQLDGITFPKWRNETIKAYGNAIVPQVALQIFKAIQQTHERL